MMIVTYKETDIMLDNYVRGDFDGGTQLITKYSNADNNKEAEKIIMTCINGCKIKAVIGGGIVGLFDLILTNDELDCYHLMQNRDAAGNVTIELHHILPNEIDLTE
ncbi:hypothetical protein IJ556_04015 [bacterium]|nr:hypothetical protein [bacterium]